MTAPVLLILIFTDFNSTLKVLLSILNSDGSKAHNTSLYTQQFIEHSSLWLCFVFYECILRVYDVNNCIVNRQLRWALLSVSCLTQAPWLTLDSTLGWRLHSPWWSSSGSARGSWFHSSSWPLCPLLPELSTNLAKRSFTVLLASSILVLSLLQITASLSAVLRT